MREIERELSAHFVLVRRLGVGGAGEVWLAQARENGRRLAVKVLGERLTQHPAALAALERECARVQALDHPHILRVEGFYRGVHGAWLTMEYAEGGDLRQLRGAPVAEVLRAAASVADALIHAHSRGLVHRDVKPANVLLTADGAPKVSDFGLALAIAEAPGDGAGRGSPFTMSPQQLEGEPAQPSDDVYGFGAMLYELLSGYPPFYPDGSPERIRTEAPAKLSTAPEALTGLIDRMLAKQPTMRPDMERVARELNAALETPSIAMMNTQQEPIRIEPPAVRPPVAAGEPLKGEWRRNAEGDAGASRGGGLPRGAGAALVMLGVLGVAFVFFALPRWMADDAPQTPRPVVANTAAASAPVEKEADKKEIDFAALARAKQEADEVRAPLVARLDALTARAAEQWGGAEFNDARGALSAADAAYEQREYVVAVEHLQRLSPLLEVLETRANEVLAQQLKVGAEALAAGRSADAQNAFQLALKLQPEHAAASQGLKRASVLDQVLKLVADGERLEASGDVNGAVGAFREALALDALTARASEGVARIEARLAGDAFASAMARGYAALSAQRYAEARSAFEAARKIRADAPEIATALRQIEQEERTGVIAERLASAQAFEAEERWAEALKEYRAVIELDATIAAANEGVARTAPRAALNEQLELYLTQPERLFSQPVRAAASESLARARSVANPGPTLQKQIATLTEWIAKANAPVQVALQSDNVTQVTIYRVGELGAFQQRSLELAPGTYTVVGTRPGYRDVRRQIRVAPGALADPVVIRCEDRI